MKPVKESGIQKAILDFLRIMGIMAWKNNTTGIYDPSRGIFRKNASSGVWDISGIAKGGRAICIEVKVPGKWATEEQTQWIVAAKEKGAVAFVAHSVVEVRDKLNEEGIINA